MRSPDSRLARLRQRAAGLRWLAMDVDGTLTDGRIYIGPDGEAMKAFSVRDGMGITLLRECGIGVAIITARQSSIVERRAAELRVDEVLQAVADKAQALRDLAKRKATPLSQVGFIGDDWPDLPALLLAGFAASVADGHPEVRRRAHWVSSARAGEGAVRELAEFILRARGDYEAALERRLASVES